MSEVFVRDKELYIANFQGHWEEIFSRKVD